MQKKRIQKCLSLLLTTAMLCNSLPITAGASASTQKWITVEGVVGGRLLFDTATGYIADADNTVLSANIPSTIEETEVVGIGSGAFSDCTMLKSVVLPDSVTYIGSYTFEDCTNLESIDIPEGVTAIYSSTFSSCSNLSSVTLPADLQSIGNHAFWGCDSLESIIIPENVTALDSYTFYSCNNLKDVVLPENLQTIENDVFNGCTSLTAITLPDTLQSIASSAFESCFSLSTIALPDTIVAIADETFRGCSSLQSIDIPDTVTVISNRAFCGCESLSSFTTPADLLAFGDDVFAGCDSLATLHLGMTTPENFIDMVQNLNALETLTVAAENEFYAVKDDVLFNKDMTALLAYPQGKQAESYAIPAGTLAVAENAFSQNQYLQSLEIGADVQGFARQRYENYITLTVAEENETYTTVDNVLFSKDKSTLLHYQENCPSASYTIPDGTTTIAENAFESAYDLRHLSIPESVTAIKDDSLSGHKYDFTLHVIANSYAHQYAVENDIDFEVFDPDITYEVSVYRGESDKDLYKVGETVTITAEERRNYNFTYWEGLENVTFVEDTDRYSPIVKFIMPAYNMYNIEANYEYVQDDCRWVSVDGIAGSEIYFNFTRGIIERVDDEEDVTIANIPSEIEGVPVTTIGDDAFCDCRYLVEVSIPGSVQTIEEYAFEDCYNLHTLTLAEGLELIGESAFEGCDSLTALYMPDSLLEIEGEAFDQCDSLTSLYIGAGYTGDIEDIVEVSWLENITVSPMNAIYEIINNSFCNTENGVLYRHYADKSITHYTVPAGITTIAEEAFLENPYLLTVTLPDSIRVIEENAFDNCERLSKVDFGQGVTTILHGAFADTNIVQLVLPDSVVKVNYWAFGNCDNIETISIGAHFASDITEIGISENEGLLTIDVSAENDFYST